MECKSTGSVSPVEPKVSFNGRELRAIVSSEHLGERKSRAVGVGIVTPPVRSICDSMSAKAAPPGHFAIDGGAVLAVAVGVSSIALRLGRFRPMRPAAPPWFEP